jgi:hypothetical protein
MKMEQIECSETSAYKIQTPGNYPEESIQQLEVTCNVRIFTGTLHLNFDVATVADGLLVGGYSSQQIESQWLL